MEYRLRILSLLLLTLVWLPSCKRNNLVNPIPNVFVDEYVYLNNPSSFNLNIQGGWVYNQGGYNGLIVYRRYFNQGPDDFIAYDRACPIHYLEPCGKLEVVEQIYLECPCEKHRYLMHDGLPLTYNSPQLRFYNTYFDGVNVIRITN